MLKPLRRAADLTITELAYKAGLSERTVRRLEAGRGNVASLKAAMAVLGKSIETTADPGQHVAKRSVRISRTSSQKLAPTIAPPTAAQVRLTVKPTTLTESNAIVSAIHRHHKPATGHRFSLTVMDDDGNVHGVLIAGRPVARKTCQSSVIEVTRVATNGTPNACSALYAAAARTAKAMGFAKIQTFILSHEPGTSLKAAGWSFDKISEGGDWNVPSRGNRRSDEKIEGSKQRWAKNL